VARLTGPDAGGPNAAESDGTEVVRVTAWVHGDVQGVGFRWWTRSRALELGLVGSATNLADGRVEVIAEGPRTACERLVVMLSSQPAPHVPPRAPRSYYRRPGQVITVITRWGPAQGGLVGFAGR
jgi:acylphosphatase